MIQKHHGNAFEDTPLKEKLEALHVSRLVVTGLVSNGCVNATCIGAHSLGYETILWSRMHTAPTARMPKPSSQSTTHGWAPEASYGCRRRPR